jgi:flavorubredoxin
MSKVELAEGVYWVGAIDWNLRSCGAYNTPYGTTYNCYLVMSDKIALVDTVKAGFEHEMLERIKEIIDPAKIDYLICNHVEFDHSGAMPALMKVAANAKVVASRMGKTGLAKHHHTDWGAEVVKTGDTISLGRKTLEFIEAPMIHWPDSMFTYLMENKILMPNDAFGQHIATSRRFEDEVGPEAMEEAAKYFAVIVSPYSTMVQKKLKEIEERGIKIDIIAPSHGVIWRQPAKIIDAYKRWSSGEAMDKVTVVFDTMWGSTARMADEIARGIGDEGLQVSQFNLRNSDWSIIAREIMDSKLLVVGSPTLNREVYPTVGGFLKFLSGLRPSTKKAAVFGSYGWGGGASKSMKEELAKGGIEVIEDEMSLQYVPSDKDLERCVEFGRRLARRVRALEAGRVGHA